jgi:tRNA1(Val) A37 N6-methylase TrmN6
VRDAMRGIARAALARANDARTLSIPPGRRSRPTRFVEVADDERVNVLGPSELVAIQTVDGYRAGVDAFALAWRARERRDRLSLVESVADLGAGSSGAVGLAYCSASPRSTRACECVFFEKQKASADRCARSVIANCVDFDARVVVADCVDSDAARTWRGRFDVVLSNPPFFERERGTPTSKSEEKMLGRFESTATIHDFCVFAREIMKPNGEFFVVYPAQGRSRVVEAMQRVFGAGVVTVTECFDHPEATEPNLVFVRASLGDETSDDEQETCALHPKPREGGGQRAYAEPFARFLRRVANAGEE